MSPRLLHLGPGWFSIVMGLSGLALAWGAAPAVAGPAAGVVSMALAGVAAAVFVLLGAATVLRALRHAQAVQQDLQHPVAHAFWAAIPVSALLMATLSVRHHGPSVWAAGLWSAGAVAQLALTLAVIRRWWRGNQPGGLVWAGITPALFIPIVGNVIVPLAGVPLGQPEWSAAQFGMGLLFWPVVMVLIMVRKATAGLWPERLLPTAFIHVAPPAVMGAALLQLGAPALIAWGAWGMALLLLLWAGTQVRRIVALPFGIPHWAMSFPLAAFTVLTLRLADPALGAHPRLEVLGLMLLGFTTALIAALCALTLRGLLRGSLLAPEAPAAPAATAQAA